MLEILTGYPDNVLAIAANGRVSAQDYADVLIPAALEKMRRHKHLRVLYRIGPGFEGYTPGGMWSDSVFGIGHWGDFGRLAVVTDVDWIAHAVHLFAPLFHHPLRAFPNSELEAARAWITAGED